MHTNHPLRTWRQKHGVSAAQIQSDIGISQSHLSLIEHGKKGVSLSKALMIERYTKGQVPLSALLPVPQAAE